MSMTYTLYDYLPSGNGYKVRLVCKRLKITYHLVQMDITHGATRTPEFLAKNLNGRIPLLEVPDRGFLAESHAIISFLAEGSDLIPDDPWERAQMWRWLCFEQYHLEPNIGTARFWLTSLKKSAAELGDRLTDKVSKGYEALAVLEHGLTDRRFLVADRFTLADIALYAYTHVAPEAGLSFDGYPHIRAWIARVAAEPQHAPITAA
jgi:glutathione S-transferase